MKVFKASINLSPQLLYQQFSIKLNLLFKDKIRKDVTLEITLTDNLIEIGQPALYETFLYQVVVKTGEVDLIKSEHYTDDVYNLAVEDIINAIIVEYIGESNLIS